MRTIRRIAAALCLATLVWAGVCAPGPRAETVLRVVPHADLKNIDPIWTTAYITRNHGYMVYDTLFALDADLVPRPQMVDRWTVSDDGLSYRFTLRDGLAWHDGAPVTAADCVASIRRWGALRPRCSISSPAISSRTNWKGLRSRRWPCAKSCMSLSMRKSAMRRRANRPVSGSN